MQNFQEPPTGVRTNFLLRGLGYCLLCLFLLDFAFLLIPPKFTNSIWELNLYGQITERVPLLLLSFPLIFFDKHNLRKPWEKIVIKSISWMTMAIAVFFILGIPLTIINTYRVQTTKQGELIVSVLKQNAPAEKFLDRLNRANSNSEIQNILKALSPQQQSSEISDPQTIKKKLLEQITNSLTESNTQLKSLKRQIAVDLWKSLVKWVIASSLSAIYLLYVWKQSRWARVV